LRASHKSFSRPDGRTGRRLINDLREAHC
jgi:hypothetical protein